MIKIITYLFSYLSNKSGSRIIFIIKKTNRTLLWVRLVFIW